MPKKQLRRPVDKFREYESKGRGFWTNWELLKENHPELFK